MKFIQFKISDFDITITLFPEAKPNFKPADHKWEKAFPCR